MSVNFTSRLKALNENTVHRYATLWRIETTDGSEPLRFTDHECSIYFNGQYYNSSDGFNVSATQRESGLNEQNKEAQGIISTSGGVTFSDLRAGKYRNATIWEFLVDWKYPWLGPIYETKYLIADVTFDGFAWKADMVGQAKYLRMPVGKIYNRNCRHLLGEANNIRSPGGGVQMLEPHCTFDMTGNFTTLEFEKTLPATIGGALTLADLEYPRKKFKIMISEDYEAQDFKYGTVSFTGTPSTDQNLNGGLVFEIANSTACTTTNVTFTALHAEFTTFIDTPYDVHAGDAVTFRVGCDKTLTTCNAKFGNSVNFGGYPDIPGVDRAILIPDTK